MGINGGAPDQPSLAEHLAAQPDLTTQLQDELRALIEVDQQQLDALDAARADVKAHQSRLRKALLALNPDAEKKAPKRGRPQLGQEKAPGEVIRPKQHVMDRVLVLVGQATEPVGPKTLQRMSEAEGEPIADSTIARALTHLRAEGQIRVAGRHSNGGRLWLPVPEVGEGEPAPDTEVEA